MPPIRPQQNKPELLDGVSKMPANGLAINAVIVFFLLLTNCTSSISPGPRTIEAHKECPLCGMFPARYPRFHCQIVFQDGSYEAFDSTIGLLVYLYFPEKTGFKVKEIHQVYFMDYLKESWIESQDTYLVVGSDIMGPMGLEFLAVDSRTAAEELIEKENGKLSVQFNHVNRRFLIKAAEEGWLHLLTKKLVLE